MQVVERRSVVGGKVMLARIIFAYFCIFSCAKYNGKCASVIVNATTNLTDALRIRQMVEIGAQMWKRGRIEAGFDINKGRDYDYIDDANDANYDDDDDDDDSEEDFDGIENVELPKDDDSTRVAFVLPNFEIDLKKFHGLKFPKRRDYELLVLDHIIEKFGFEFGADVLEWTHVLHNRSTYFIGRRARELLIIEQLQQHDFEPQQQRYMARQRIQLDAAAAAAAAATEDGHLSAYSFWNNAREREEGVIVIAIDSALHWYFYDDEQQQFERRFKWQFDDNERICAFKYFRTGSDDASHEYLIVATSQGLSIYLHALGTGTGESGHGNVRIALAQFIQLERACAPFAYIESARGLIIASVQPNRAEIYEYRARAADAEADNSAAGLLNFRLTHNVSAPAIADLSLFQLGGRTFLALGGRDARIMHFEAGHLLQNTLLAASFGHVDLYFPVPLRNYRDDLLLIVQHNVNFRTHKVVELTVLIWNGTNYESSLPPPCYVGAHIFKGGATCMLDHMRAAGLRGATLIETANAPLVLVPRANAVSGLFELHTHLLPVNAETVELQASWDALAALAQTDMQIVQSALDALNETQAAIVTPKLTLAAGVQFERLLVNERLWTAADSAMPLQALIADLRALDGDLKRMERQLQHPTSYDYAQLVTDVVNVNELSVERLNDAPFYIQNAQLQFNGTLQLQELHVSETLHLPMLPELRTNGIEFESINDVPWTFIAKNLVALDNALELNELKVDGQVIFASNVSISKLNALAFPQDYLWQADDAYAADSVDARLEFHGTKTFAGTLTVNDLHIDDDILKQQYQFEELTINGPLIIDETGTELAALLLDIAQRPLDANATLELSGAKQFAALALPTDLTLTNSTINDIPVQHFMTANTHQLLNLSAIHGNVYFERLRLKGSFDGVNIDELLLQALRIDAAQHAPNTRLTFANAVEFGGAHGLHVQARLNGIPLATDVDGVGGYLSLRPATALVARAAYFTDLTVDAIEMQADNVGNGSWKRAPEQLHIRRLKLQHDLSCEQLQQINCTLLIEMLRRHNNTAAATHFRNVTVNGSVQLRRLNGHSFKHDILNKVIWLNRPNRALNASSWRFVQPVTLRGDLQVLGNYNGQHFPTLVNDIVFRQRNENVLQLTGKRFLNDVHVRQAVQLHAINDVPFKQLATHNLSSYSGVLRVRGNLNVQDISLRGQCNGVSIAALSELLRYNETLQDFVLAGLYTTPNATLANYTDLTIYGRLNDYEQPVAEFFSTLVYRHAQEQRIKELTLTGRVTITNDAHIRMLNDIDLVELLRNIVYAHERRPVTIKSPVVFHAPISMKKVTVHGQLITEQLNGCALKHWLDDTLRLDKDAVIVAPVHIAPSVLNGNDLQVRRLNGNRMEQLFTLHTPQNLSGPLTFQELYLVEAGDIAVSSGVVNNVRLFEAYQNTLMKTPLNASGQHITTPLHLRNMSVRANLDVECLVNHVWNLSEVATLHEPLVLEAPLYFETSHPVPHDDDDEGSIRVERCASRLVKQFLEQPTSYILKRIELRFTQMLDMRNATIRRAYAYDFEVREAHAFYLAINSDDCQLHVYKLAENSSHYVHLSSYQPGPLADVELQLTNVTGDELKFVLYSAHAEQSNCTIRASSAWHFARMQRADVSAMPNAAAAPTKIGRRSQFRHPTTATKLRLNIRDKQNFTYNDYREQTVRLLDDLSFRLYMEANITLLSMPETDLYDEHLFYDAQKYAHKLSKQNFYPNASFADVPFDLIWQPVNPAQVLATRSLQIIWPAIVNAEKLHKYLAKQDKTTQCLHRQVKQLLGNGLRKLLTLPDWENATPNVQEQYMPDLDALLVQLQAFQRGLQLLKLHINMRNCVQIKLETSQNKSKVTRAFTRQAFLLHPFTAKQERQMPTMDWLLAHSQPMQLTIPVGAHNESHLMTIQALSSSIEIYDEAERLFQTLDADQPRLLLDILRFRDETLFVFVERCCHIRVFQYRGLQGFIEFAHFQVPTPIVHLMAMRLPHATQTFDMPGHIDNLLAVVQLKQIHFYDIVLLHQPEVLKKKCTM